MVYLVYFMQLSDNSINFWSVKYLRSVRLVSPHLFVSGFQDAITFMLFFALIFYMKDTRCV